MIHSDETPIQVLTEPGKCVGSKSCMWVMARGSPYAKSAVFHYHSSRAHIVPKSLFANCRGYLQADGYSGCGPVTKDESPIRRIGCRAHVRRKFVDALKSALRGGEGTVANEAVHVIKDLY